MRLVPLNSIFDVEYGNQFDLSKMTISDDFDNINFISRASKNFGIQAKVSSYEMIKPFNPGLITVTLGGSYLLTAFIQPSKFYTAQNIKILKPKIELSYNEKLFYCVCIQKNRFKYSSHGREANVSLDTLPIPSKMPKEFEKISLHNLVNNISKPLLETKYKINLDCWQYYYLTDLFEIFKGQDQINKCYDGDIPLISAIGSNNGITKFVDNGIRLFDGNCISVVMNGISTGQAFYQSKPFYATADISILKPRFKLNKYIALFICTIIKKEKFRFSYGRKWYKKYMEKDKILLPTNRNDLDFDFMENYIKSLPFSNSL